eukprot:246530_1
MSGPSRFLLIDCHSVAVRCFYASIHKSVTNSHGKPIGALFGYAHSLVSTIAMLRPTHIAACLESRGKTFRHDLYSDYKCKREKHPEDLQSQLDHLSDLSLSIGCHPVYVDRYEADDIVGALCKNALQSGMEVQILSVDKDFTQLLEPDVTMFSRRRSFSYFSLDKQCHEIITHEDVYKKYGVHPCQFADYLALVGDAADNIPGAPGIGPVWAKRLLAYFGTVDGILKAAAEDRSEFGGPKRRKSIVENAELIRKCHELAKIHRDIPGVPDLEVFRFNSFPVEDSQATEVLHHLGLEDVIERMKKVGFYTLGHGR